MTKSTPLTMLDIRGEQVKVSVSERGWFTGTIHGKTCESDTLEKLKKDLTIAGRQAAVKVNIPAVRVFEHTHNGALSLESVSLTGIHATTHSILYRDAMGRAATSDAWREFMRPLTPEEAEELKRLFKAHNDAEKAWKAASKPKFIDAKEVIRAEINAAIKEPENA